MADSWTEASEEARRGGFPLVFHDLDRKIYGACRREDDCGHFSRGCFVSHRAICMRAETDPVEMAEKEATFLKEHPEFVEEHER
ncbi:hypothetical protein DSECCO2_465020 [anaerobic digester metagenome]